MVNWTSDVDAKLFACVIKQVTTLNLQKLATDMAAQNIGKSTLPSITLSPSPPLFQKNKIKFKEPHRLLTAPAQNAPPRPSPIVFTS